MAVRLYNEYIKVDPNFIAVFSKNSDKVYPDKWQSFYPHDSFKNILKDVVETLEQGSELKNLSIWMSGAYGTGKTYASFVIKHMLEDDLDSIAPYFRQNKMDTLFSRLNGIRSKGKILVVHRSSSAGINTSDKLLNSIIDSVRQTVLDSGFSYVGSESLLDKILTMLKNPEMSAFNFQGVFNKYRGKFTEYSSVDGIIRDLEELEPEDKMELLNTIIEVAALEKFNWSMSPDEVVSWLEDIRIGNGLYAIVFIWDEFTEYFKNNPNNISGLQEIVMASSRIGFYFFLITHGSPGQLIHDKGAMKVIEARFKLDTIDLEEKTAFKLLAQALHHNSDLADEWDYTCNQLYDGVMHSCIKTIKNKDLNIKDDDFKALLPLHPYAAYILKFIAKDVSSNQRTIFQFLCGDYSGEDKTNFKWFIDRFGYDYGKWNYLTVDYLWDYFFRASNVDLDSAFIQTMSHYDNYAPLCDDINNSSLGDRRRRVLKATLLLVALQTKNSADAKTGVTSLMRPTLENIKACFAGTPQESTVEQDLNYFDTKGIVGKIESAREILFVMTSSSVDTERMKQCVEDTRKAITFEKVISDSAYDVAKQFLPTDNYLKQRMKIVNVSPMNARQEAEKAEITYNHIPTFFLFARNEAEQGKIKETIPAIFEKVGERCIVVDFSSLPFTDALFTKFIENKAKEKYFSTLPNQKSQLELAKKISKEVLDEWTRKLITTSLYVYSAPNKMVQRVGGANLRKTFKEINSGFYSCGLEEISQNDKLFAESGFKETVAQMAMGKLPVPNNYSYVRSVSGRLETDGIWNNDRYWEVNPNHPVSQMKIIIKRLMESGFEKSSMASLEDIWHELQKPPFGLMPNTGSVFLLGFLLQEYADSTYYKRDNNNNTVELNYISLSELIFGVVKELPKAKGQYIARQTPEQAYFCKTIGEIFKISGEKRNSVEDIAKNINLYLTHNKYPLWAIRYFIEEDFYDHEYRDAMIELTNLLCEFVKPESKIGRERSKVVGDIYKMLCNYPTIEEIYSTILNAENMCSGMNYYIAQYKPELIQIAGNLNVEMKEYLELLNSKLSKDSSYLWEIGDTNRQIDNLYIDLKLIYDLNRVLTTKQKTYVNAKNALIEKLNIIKVPYSLLKEFKPELTGIINQFYLIKADAHFDKSSTSAQIADLADDFNEFFNNQFETFCEIIDSLLKTSISSEEHNYLFNKVPSGMLFKTTDSFVTTMQHELMNYRKSKKIRKMYDIWQEKTNSMSPAVWSKENGIPILCMFTEDIVKAQKVFDAINRTSNLPNENDIDGAVEFLKSSKMDILNDKAECEKRFIEMFAGNYSYVITSVDELKDIIRSVAGSNVYDWYAKRKNCENKIIQFASERYRSKYSVQAKSKVHRLTAEQAQKYLEELIDKDPLLGIRILKE